MLEALQSKVNAVAGTVSKQPPICSQCGQPMKRHDSETVHWLARYGRLNAAVERIVQERDPRGPPQEGDP